MDATWVAPHANLDLAELLNFCSAGLELPIDYDPRQVSGRVLIRTGRGVSGHSLWAQVNRILVNRKLACIQAPGEETLTIVELPMATRLARLEPGPAEDAQAGFIKALVPLRQQPPHDYLNSLRNSMSVEGTTLLSMPDSDHMLVVGLKEQVLEIVAALQAFAGGSGAPVVREYSATHLPASTLISFVQKIGKELCNPNGRPLAGALHANPSSNTVVLVAPEDDAIIWEGLIERFDQVESISTRTYSPAHHNLHAVVKLLEDTIGTTSMNPPTPDNWNVVTDDLSGSLIITAAPSRHARIEEVLQRLDDSAQRGRKHLRAFPIRHREIDELLTVLNDLMKHGAVATVSDDSAAALAAEPPRNATGGRVGDADAEWDVVLTKDQGSNRILAIGSEYLLDELGLLIDSLDKPHPQVIVEALVVALSDSQAHDLAIELSKVGDIGRHVGRLSTLFGGGNLNPSDSSLPGASGTGLEGVILDPGSFSGVLRALESLNEGRSLTIPKVLVNNNQTATLDSILQSPFTSTNASSTVATTSFGGTMDAGTKITVTPQITEGDRLLLKYAVSLSSFVGDSVDPSVPPPRQENSLDSMATVPDGYAVVVGGLETETETEAESQVPLLGSIPLLGNLFKSQSKSKTRSRFFVFLRCSVLRHARFEDLRHLGQRDLEAAGIELDWPTVEPRIIR